MRLLSTHWLELRTFPDRDGSTPPYAILSHVWSQNPNDEVLFDDIQNGKAQSKPAFAKLSRAMQEASEKYDWLWCDTCCIDKSSSAELSEGINSMFSWYESSAVCYAYIEDILSASVEDIKTSRWFTRGWTLQELLAPDEVIFYNATWKSVGSKRSVAIRDMISDRTKISADVLDGTRHLRSVSVAQRMSWVAGRAVTRPEDIAYCLMGIFQVNMPMLYGEGGRNAFLRLQEHIMRDSNDHSLFAWTMRSGSTTVEHHGLLADSPDAFAECSNIIAYFDFEEEKPYQQSNSGLRIDLHLTPVLDGTGTFYAALNCPIPSNDMGYYGFLGIRLKKLASGKNQYTRVRCQEIKGLTERGHHLATVYVRQTTAINDTEATMPSHFFVPRNLVTPGDSYTLLSASFYKLEQGERPPLPIIRSTSWFAASQASSFKITRLAGKISAVLWFSRQADDKQLLLLLGAIDNLEVGFAIAVADEDIPIETLESAISLEPPGTVMEVDTHKVTVDSTVSLDVPRKLYILDITIDGTAPPPVHDRPPIMSQQGLQQAANDTVRTVQNAIAGPDAHRYRPKSLLVRARRAAGFRTEKLVDDSDS